MKKVILTVAALVVSASMVLAFAGCDKEPTGGEETSTNEVVAEVEDSTAA